jgi:hypothetical protein
MAFEVGAWVCATFIAALLWKVWWDETRGDRLRRQTAEYRRREAVLIRTVALLAGVPTQPHRRLREIRYDARRA